MQFEYDEAKSQRNEAERGLPFSMVAGFDFETAMIDQDLRFDYPEPRFEAIGWLNGRLHVVVFCLRGENTRLISFRKANEREVKKYERVSLLR